MQPNNIMSLRSSLISIKQASSNWLTGLICRTRWEIDECTRMTKPLPISELMLVENIEKF